MPVVRSSLMEETTMSRMNRTLTLALTIAASHCAGSAPSQPRPDPINTWKTAEGLGKEFRDTGAAIAQIETVKRIPFFNLDGKQRVERFSTYGSALRERDFKGAATNLNKDFSSGLIKDLGVVFMS